MAGFFNKIKNPGAPVSVQTNREIALKKKDELPPELTPLEKMLLNAGPLREDGTDRFFGFENFGNTCYCNSIVQALFYSDLFRESVINFPPSSPSDTSPASRSRVPVTLRPPMSTATAAQPKKTGKDASKSKPGVAAPQPGTGQGAVRPEDKPDTPEYKKKQAMIKGPILELVRENSLSYGMDECTFTGLKDIFLAIQQSNTRTGVLSPQRFLEIFKRDNEMFRNSMHQDAHEFYGVVLNDVIANVESNARKMQERLEAEMDGEMDSGLDSGLDSSMDPKVDAKSHRGLTQSVEKALGSALIGNASGYRTPGTGWVHDIFEGLLTSETKCLTCETASQRDETFLDLSIDLEEHSSVTACLRKFSAEEMLCERNKFHCDHCGGLHEAEKRMKVKRLPKVLTLHLKRFKYTEDYSRLQKLFHRVVYPYHLRMFNTTDDAEDQDRLYELYAVVVHIGGNAYHGHYVSIIKTKDRGWVLFDDEMVEPVDKHFVRNFFGDKPGMATAYVLFYQETTFDKVREEQEREGMEEVVLATLAANVAQTDNGDKPEPVLRRQATQPMPGNPPPLHAEQESLVSLTHAHTEPTLVAPPAPKKEGIAAATNHGGPVGGVPKASLTGTTVTKVEAKTRDELKRERREREAVEKAAKMVEKEREKHVREEDKKRREEQLRTMQARRAEQEEVQRALDASKKSAVEEEAARKREDNGPSNGSLGFLERSRRGSRSMTKRSFSFFNKEKHRMSLENVVGDAVSEKPDKVKGRLSMGLGRKKSSNLLA